MIIDVGYPLGPPTVPPEQIRDCITSLWRWLFDDLHTALQIMVGADMQIRWDSVLIFGGSWGGRLALMAWLATASLDQKPEEFRVLIVFARDPIRLTFNVVLDLTQAHISAKNTQTNLARLLSRRLTRCHSPSLKQDVRHQSICLRHRCFLLRTPIHVFCRVNP